jgi:hypothetical protein
LHCRVRIRTRTLLLGGGGGGGGGGHGGEHLVQNPGPIRWGEGKE